NDKALDCLGRALPLRRDVRDRPGEARTLLALARAERDRGDLAGARSRADAALEMVESLRTGVADPDLRMSFLGAAQKYYGFEVDLLMEMNRRQPGESFDAQALHASERARARSLLDLL